ncbi:hypothetical protein [Arsukibacterium sp.]|nr:hypothetical protein [Arsukibacterium sp.]
MLIIVSHDPALKALADQHWQLTAATTDTAPELTTATALEQVQHEA